MIRRKAEIEIENMKKTGFVPALLLDGARQVGKTFVVRHCAERHYKQFIEVNFIENPEAKALFQGAWNRDEFFVKLTALTNKSVRPHETLVFFDEVQECPEVVTYVKFLVDDGRCHYVLSGSLLGVELKDIRSVPVGYLREVRMFPLDFEEFVRALGVQDEVLDHVRRCCADGKSIDALVHERMMRCFRLYLVVGGMPAAVQTYLKTNDLKDVLAVQRAVLKMYAKDAAKYDSEHRMQIQRVMELIPAELNAQNKRFYVSDIKKGEKFERQEDNFVWLAKAGIALPVYNVDSPVIPLELAKKANLFKLFMNDVGLLAAQYMDGIQLKLLNGELDVNFGAVFENFVAQELSAHGYEKLYFFNSKKHGELDFLVTRNQKVLPLEIKSGADYKSHAALDAMMKVRDFALEEARVYGDFPAVEAGCVSYYPIYALMYLLNDVLPERMVYPLPV